MDADFRTRLVRTFRWVNDGADVTGWWRDPEVIRGLAAALASLHPESTPTAVLGVESSGFFLAGLVALHLNIGVVEVRKGTPKHKGTDRHLVRHAPPDYQDRDLVSCVPRDRLREQDRILFVDEWIETGAQAETASGLVEDAGAEWLGGAVIVDNTEWAVRRRLNIRSLLHIRELPE